MLGVWHAQYNYLEVVQHIHVWSMNCYDSQVTGGLRLSKPCIVTTIGNLSTKMDVKQVRDRAV
jgi:hypothetical protein